MRILAALLAAFSLNCAAAPYNVRLGLDRIVLDAPPGFTDTTELASPRLQDLAASLTAASNRVLLFALTDADLRRFTNGDRLEAKRYLIVVAPKGMERERVSAATFSAYVADSQRGLGKPAATGGDVFKFLDRQPIGQANLLSELRKDPEVVSVIQGTRLQPLPGATMWDREKPQYLIFATTIMLLRGKALQVAAYGIYEAPGDVAWYADVMQRWVSELQRLNRQ